MTNLRQLTRKHGVRVVAQFPCSVEDVALAVGEKVGYDNVRSVARMNSAVVIFLDQVEQANAVVESGITVADRFVPVQPLSQPAVRVVLSNVPPFMPDELLIRELSRFGKVVSSVKDILSGCKSQLLKNAVCHRRHVFMILNNRSEELNLRFRVRVNDYDYVVFASSAGMKCFSCGQEGHTIRACPAASAPSGSAESGPAESGSAESGSAETDLVGPGSAEPGSAAAAALALTPRANAWGGPPPRWRFRAPGSWGTRPGLSPSGRLRLLGPSRGGDLSWPHSRAPSTG